MWRRVAMHVTADLDELEQLMAAAPGPIVAVVDADNTLAPQGAPLDEFQAAVTASVRRFESLPSVDRVIPLSNGPERGVPGMISRGNKPWTTRRRLGLTGVQANLWVVGDQVLTDGLLAWRLGASFVHHVIDDQDEPRRQAIMRRLGRGVARVLLKDGGSPAAAG
jgi:predicted HAD superfamily phosphohydrolase YqeG